MRNVAKACNNTEATPNSLAAINTAHRDQEKYVTVRPIADLILCTQQYST